MADVWVAQQLIESVSANSTVALNNSQTSNEVITTGGVVESRLAGMVSEPVIINATVAARQSQFSIELITTRKISGFYKMLVTMN